MKAQAGVKKREKRQEGLRRQGSPGNGRSSKKRAHERLYDAFRLGKSAVIDPGK